MAESRNSGDLPLFRDVPGGPPPLGVRPWRTLPADTWTAERPPSAAALEQQAPEVLRRDLEFLRAIELHGGQEAVSGADRFLECHEALVHLLVRWRDDANASRESVNARPALETLRELAELRDRILTGLDASGLAAVQTAESRVRIPDHEVEWALRKAEFELAEEKGEVVEIEIPASEDPPFPSGFIGPGMIDGIVQAHMEHMRAEQERRPLPARGGLATFLRNLPVEWLDAMWDALDLGAERPRHRKERERVVAGRLAEDDTLRRVVADRLSGEERRLLAYLLERGGQASIVQVARRFGSDRGDGWFWNEEPPASVLGRVRLHGMAFVGADGPGSRKRTVLVPGELREGLEKALAAVGERIGDGDAADDVAAPDLRPDVMEALDAAFPDGVVTSAAFDPDVDALPEEPRRELARLSGAEILYERTLDGADHGGPADESDPEDFLEWEPESWIDPDRSYGLLFLSPRHKKFRFDIEGEFVDEDGRVRPTTGSGRIGLAVAVSAVAPFALVRVTSLDTEEGGGTALPDIETRWFDEAGRPVAEEPFFLDMLGEEAKSVLADLRSRIAAALDGFGITVLPEEDARQTVPWLEADDDVLVGGVDESLLTVEDAFFFRYLS